jgi:hypothetical protein
MGGKLGGSADPFNEKAAPGANNGANAARKAGEAAIIGATEAVDKSNGGGPDGCAVLSMLELLAVLAS